MTWLVRNVDLVSGLLAEHVWLALVPVVVGLLLALPLGWAATRVPRVRFALLSAAGLLYTVPSLVLFVSLPVVLGTQILSPLNIVVALTLYTVALLVRTVADALDAAPPAVLTAATAMGYWPLRRFVAVELPLAVPVIVAGLRVASVSNISLVTVGSIIGIGGQGENARLTCPIKKQRPALRHPRRRRTQQFAAQDHLQSAAPGQPLPVAHRRHHRSGARLAAPRARPHDMIIVLLGKAQCPTRATWSPPSC